MPTTIRERSFARNPLTVDDLAGLGTAELAEVVTKANVWPRPDWQELVDSGVSPKQAAFARIVHRRIASAPVAGEDDANANESYVKAIGIIRDVLLTPQSGNLHQISVLLSESLRSQMGSIGGNCPSIQSRTNRTPPFRLRDSDIADIKEAVSAGFPGPVKTWKRGLEILRQDDGSYDVTRSGYLVARGLPSEDAAWAHMAKHQERAAWTPSPPDLFRYTRNGPDNAENVDEAMLCDTFGLQDVFVASFFEPDEQKRLLDDVHGCLVDLSDAMGIDFRSIGFYGSLSVSIGRSHRGAMDIVRSRHDRGDVREIARVFARQLLIRSDGVGGAFAKAVADVVERCQYVNRPTSDIKADRKQELIDAQKLVVDRESQLSEFQAIGARRAGLPFVDGRGSLQDHQRRLEEARSELTLLASSSNSKVIKKVPSAFSLATTIAYQGPLSRTPQIDPSTLFVRAFEAWVSDRLAEMGRHNDMLAHSTEPGRAAIRNGTVYPSGGDRVALAKLFDKVAAMLLPEPAPQPKLSAPRP